jgi:hypothetical protein
MAMKIIPHTSSKILITCLKNATSIKTTQRTSFTNVLSKTFMEYLNVRWKKNTN